jgi:hypothetical protein
VLNTKNTNLVSTKNGKSENTNSKTSFFVSEKTENPKKLKNSKIPASQKNSRFSLFRKGVQFFGFVGGGGFPV